MMNLNKATTESFFVYNKSHESLNMTLKVSTASVSEVSRLVDVPNGATIMGELIDNLNLPWGAGKKYPKPARIISNVIANISNNGIMQAFSSFELYLTHLIADMANFSTLSEVTFKHAHADSEFNPNRPPTFANCCFAYAEQYAKDTALSARLGKMRTDLDVVDSTFDKLVPLWDYFRLIRNCIAHLEGIANKDLITHSETQEFMTAYQFWNTNFAREKAPELPVLKRGKKIELTVVHAIFSSAVNYKIGQMFNKRAVETLDEKGIVNMACYYALLIDEHEYRYERTPKPRTAEALLTHYMNSRYLVPNLTSEIMIQELMKYDLWIKARKRFELLFPKTK